MRPTTPAKRRALSSAPPGALSEMHVLRPRLLNRELQGRRESVLRRDSAAHLPEEHCPNPTATRARSQQANGQQLCATRATVCFGGGGGWGGNRGNSQEAEEARSLSEEAGPDLRPGLHLPSSQTQEGKGRCSTIHPTRRHGGRKEGPEQGWASWQPRCLSEASRPIPHHQTPLGNPGQPAGLSCATQ